MIHRDVKPANILFSEDGSALLADFGVARLVDATGVTATGTALGTPAYLAPEQVEGRDLGPATDIYALGLVLAEALTGRRVFEGPAGEIVAARLARDPELPESLSSFWSALLGSMTRRDPSAWPTAEEVRDSLKAARLGPPADRGATARLDSPTEQLNPASIGGPETRKSETVAPSRVEARIARTATPVARRSRVQERDTSARRVLTVACLVAVLLVGLGFGIASWFGSPGGSAPRSTHAASKRPKAGSNARKLASSTTTPQSSTTTTAPSTTTTTPPSTTTTTIQITTIASTSGQLVSAIQDGVEDGAIAQPAAQALFNALQPLFTQPSQFERSSVKPTNSRPRTAPWKGCPKGSDHRHPNSSCVGDRHRQSCQGSRGDTTCRLLCRAGGPAPGGPPSPSQNPPGHGPGPGHGGGHGRGDGNS